MIFFLLIYYLCCCPWESFDQGPEGGKDVILVEQRHLLQHHELSLLHLWLPSSLPKLYHTTAVRRANLISRGVQGPGARSENVATIPYQSLGLSAEVLIHSPGAYVSHHSTSQALLSTKQLQGL